jgi:hypothetical protein
MTETLWISFLQNAGVAMVMLVAIGISFWRFFAWLGKRLDEWVVPIVKKHLEFITQLETHLHTQTSNITKQSDVLEKLLQRIERLEQIQDRGRT